MEILKPKFFLSLLLLLLLHVIERAKEYSAVLVVVLIFMVMNGCNKATQGKQSRSRVESVASVPASASTSSVVPPVPYFLAKKASAILFPSNAASALHATTSTANATSTASIGSVSNLQTSKAITLSANGNAAKDKMSNINNKLFDTKEVVEKSLQNPLPLSSGIVLSESASAVLQHTSFVGSTDFPTIDGGIINAVDGLPVHSVNFDTINKGAASSASVSRSVSAVSTAVSSSASSPTLSSAAAPVLVSAPASASFAQDNWATTPRVKRLLEAAVRNGKLDYVLKKLDEKGLPASVATVPMIESNYRETATSPKGAAGAWQLMSHTAQDYGLAKDERYKFTAATKAALDLLYDLYQQFNSWELAFAAYNAGAKRVQDALRKSPRATSVQELDLPQETKAYVTRIMLLNKTMAQMDV